MSGKIHCHSPHIISWLTKWYSDTSIILVVYIGENFKRIDIWKLTGACGKRRCRKVQCTAIVATTAATACSVAGFSHSQLCRFDALKLSMSGYSVVNLTQYIAWQMKPLASIVSNSNTERSSLSNVRNHKDGRHNFCFSGFVTDTCDVSGSLAINVNVMQ